MNNSEHCHQPKKLKIPIQKATASNYVSTPSPPLSILKIPLVQVAVAVEIGILYVPFLGTAFLSPSTAAAIAAPPNMNLHTLFSLSGTL